MDSRRAGELVKVASGGPEVDGIVFDVPSSTKVVVAVVDRAKGPVLRTVPAASVSEREQAGADDRALQLLLRRTPPPQRGGSRGGPGAIHGHAGHTRGAAHRPTGR